MAAAPQVALCDTPPIAINANLTVEWRSDSMQGSDPSLVAALTGLCSDAGRAILDLARDALNVREKADLSPLTAADEAAQSMILNGLARLLPGLPVVSEESAAPQIAHGASFLLVDPLDGTREFIAGREEYTVNLALIEAGHPVLGFVFLPAHGRLYRGRIGQFAERLRLPAGAPADAAEEISPLRPRAAPSRLTAVVSRLHLDPDTESLLASLPLGERIVSGSSLKFGLLAEGLADVYPRLAPTHEWDIAAGHAVLAAAGGRVIRPDGAALTYGRAGRGFRVPGFVAWADPRAALGPGSAIPDRTRSPSR
jgi:3'(2'), 5'-bisphosphate nucleotidase